jgi:NADH-quinone oxidoreductase subunit M
MLRLAQQLLFGKARAPHQPFADLDTRERAILVAIVVAVFAIGLYPEEPLRKTELAAREYQQIVMGTQVDQESLP